MTRSRRCSHLVEPIIINFRWTVADLLTARRWHFRHVCRPLFRWAVHIVIVLIIAVSLFSLLRAGFSAIPVGFLIAGFYIYALRPFEIRWLTRRQFSKRPDRNLDVQWTVTSERLSTITPHGTAEFQWKALSKVIQFTDGFLFYPTDQIFHFLPRRGFRDDNDFRRLAELAKIHSPKFVKVT